MSCMKTPLKRRLRLDIVKLAVPLRARWPGLRDLRAEPRALDADFPVGRRSAWCSRRGWRRSSGAGFRAGVSITLIFAAIAVALSSLGILGGGVRSRRSGFRSRRRRPRISTRRSRAARNRGDRKPAIRSSAPSTPPIRCSPGARNGPMVRRERGRHGRFAPHVDPHRSAADLRDAQVTGGRCASGFSSSCRTAIFESFFLVGNEITTSISDYLRAKLVEAAARRADDRRRAFPRQGPLRASCSGSSPG